MKRILTIRIIETIFLAFFVIEAEISPNKIAWDIDIIHLGLSFSVSQSDSIVLSSTFIGFVFSLIGTLKQKSLHNQWLNASLAFSVLGIICYSNEFLRLLLGYDLKILLTFPALLLAFDWMAYSKLKKKSSNQLVEHEPN